jgi:HSA
MPPRKGRRATFSGGRSRSSKAKTVNNDIASAGDLVEAPIAGNDNLYDIRFQDLVQRQNGLLDRLAVTSVPLPPVLAAAGTNPSGKKTTDTHWDFLLKEMLWLSTDFHSERKRHLQSRRRLCTAVQSYHANQHVLYQRRLQQAELARRKLAKTLSSKVKVWWQKMDRVVTYKQKLSAEQAKRQEMDQQLLELVQQTERYYQGKATQQRQDVSLIELALDQNRERGRRQRRVRDYNRIVEQDDASAASRDSYLYGEATTDSGSDDETYRQSEDQSGSDSDDMSTFHQALREEMKERRRLSSFDVDEDIEAMYETDPVELERLLEESTLDLSVVLERLREEQEHLETSEDMASHSPTAKRVQFIPTPGRDAAQDNGDEIRGDVVQGGRPESEATTAINDETEHDSSPQSPDFSDDDGEFSVDKAMETEVDDETTLIQEESLPQEISPADEIRLLQEEGELPIEELRRRYAASVSEQSHDQNEHSNGEVDRSEKSGKGESNPPATATSSDEGSRSGQSLTDHENEADDEEFSPVDGMDVDDETTMAQEELLPQEMTAEDEIRLLQNEGEMPIEELRQRYAAMLEGPPPGAGFAENSLPMESDVASADLDDRSSSTDESFDAGETEPAVDDETTMMQEESLPQEMTASEEIDLLRAESEIPVEHLRAMYASIAPSGLTTVTVTGPITRPRRKRKHDGGDEAHSIKSGRTGSNHGHPKTQSDSAQDALMALDQSVDRARTTLASRPFLLSSWVKMREYQQIGLNWLVSLQARRLNGILADGKSA